MSGGTVIALIAIAAVAALTLLAVVVAVTTSRRRGDDRVTRALEGVTARMDALSADLAATVERAQRAGRETDVLAGLVSTLDLEEALRMTAEAAASAPGADAAIVHALDPAGEPIVGSSGIPAAEAGAHAVSGPPDGAPARAVTLGYHYRPGEATPESVRSGIAVPLEAEGQSIGYVAAFSRSAAPLPVDQTLAELERLADRAGPAIENARRYREARQLADVDALTGLFNQRTFHETLRREVDRGRRYGRRLTLLLVDFDNFKDVNDRIGHLAGDRVLAEVAERMREAVRSADIACRIGGDEFALVLPESSRADGHGLFARILATLQRFPPTDAPGLTLSGGIAEARPDDDALTLFERADAALYRAKASGRGFALDDGAEP